MNINIEILAAVCRILSNMEMCEQTLCSECPFNSQENFNVSLGSEVEG